MEGARFKMLPVFGLLLLPSWSLTCVHGTAFNTHELILYIFELAEKDVRYLDKLVEIHTKNGVFDKAGYDNALKQRNPLLHAKMENFRRIYREVEKENKEAVGFIDTLFITARSVRGSVITTAEEMRLIQYKFNSSSNSAQQYLMKKFPLLKFLGESSPGQMFTGTPTHKEKTSTSSAGTTTSRGTETSTSPGETTTSRGIETSTSSAGTTTSRGTETSTSSGETRTSRGIETSTSSAGKTTSPSPSAMTISPLLQWQMRKILENVANKLEKGITPLEAFEVERFKPVVDALRNVVGKPLPWKYEETFKPIIEDYAKAAEVVKEYCMQLPSDSWCREKGTNLADMLTELFRIAVTADPANSSLRKLSDNYTRAKANHPDDLLSIIAGLTSP